jgi:hypothetical protein
MSYNWYCPNSRCPESPNSAGMIKNIGDCPFCHTLMEKDDNFAVCRNKDCLIYQERIYSVFGMPISSAQEERLLNLSTVAQNVRCRRCGKQLIYEGSQGGFVCKSEDCYSYPQYSHDGTMNNSTSTPIINKHTNLVVTTTCCGGRVIYMPVTDRYVCRHCGKPLDKNETINIIGSNYE